MIYCPVVRRPQYSELIIIFITAVHNPHFVTMTCIIGSIMIFILFYYLSTHLVCFMSLPIVWMRQKHRLGLSVCLCVRTCMPGRRHCLASLPSTSCNFSLYLLPVKYHLFLLWIKINYRTVLLISTIVGDNTAGRFAPTLCEYIGLPPEGESWVEWITIWKPVSL